MLLGDLGADVIKIEPPGARRPDARLHGLQDEGRRQHGLPQHEPQQAQRHAEPQVARPASEVLLQLAKDADILVENYRPGAMKRLGLGYEALQGGQPAAGLRQHLGLRPDRALGRPARLRPDGAGDVGRDERHRLSRRPAGEGRRAGGRHRLRAVRGLRDAGGLHRREEARGQGQYVDASLFDAALAFSVWDICDYWGTGKPPEPLGTSNKMTRALPGDGVRRTATS